MELESRPVLDFCFTSAPFSDVIKKAGQPTFYERISDILQFNIIFSNAKLIGVPENFLNVTGTDFYDYKEVQRHVEGTRKTADGKFDAISLLYSDDAVDQYQSFPFAEQNGNQIFTGAKRGKNHVGPTWTLKMLIPGTAQN